MTAERTPANAVIIEQPVYFAPVPADGYDVMVQTMAVLGHDGYPAGVQSIPLADVARHDKMTNNPLRASSHREAQFVIYDAWLEPMVERGFSRFVTATTAADLASQNIPSIEVSELGLTGFNSSNSRTAIGLALNLPQSAVYNNYQLAETLSAICGSRRISWAIR